MMTVLRRLQLQRHALLLFLLVSTVSCFATTRRGARSSSHDVTSTTMSRLHALGKLAPKKNEPDPGSYAEKSRLYRRDFYTHESWLKHRAKNRFVGSFLKVFDSGVVRQLGDEVLLVGAAATFCCVWNALLVTGYTDWNMISHEAIQLQLPLLNDYKPILIRLPGEPFVLSSAALALLLVFKTNTSYARWDEARKAWGVVVNNCRTIVREAAAWALVMNVPDSRKYELVRRIADAIWLFPRSLQRHLWQPYEDCEPYNAHIRARLLPGTGALADDMINARHKPSRALYELSQAINELPLETFQRTTMDQAVSQLCDAMGGCDRIFSSPVPSIYTRHAARFLEMWIFFLPLALWKPFENSWNHTGMIPASMLIAFFLLGIEELAIQLEEPFSVLPLDKIASGIGLSAEEHVEWMEQALEEQAQDYKNRILYGNEDGDKRGGWFR